MPPEPGACSHLRQQRSHLRQKVVCMSHALASVATGVQVVCYQPRSGERSHGIASGVHQPRSAEDSHSDGARRRWAYSGIRASRAGCRLRLTLLRQPDQRIKLVVGFAGSGVLQNPPRAGISPANSRLMRAGPRLGSQLANSRSSSLVRSLVSRS